MAKPSLFVRTRRALAHRFGLEPLREHVVERRVPRTPWYFGDGASLLVLLLILVGTGVTMALVYQPSTAAARDSVLRLTNEVPFGWFVRALHYWAAGTMVLLLFVHVFRQILFGGYKAPREGTWWLGVGMFVLVHVMSLSGYVLRWDARGVHAVGVVLHVLERVPLCGEFLARAVAGGPHVGEATLPRFFAVHTILVPLLLLPLAGYHLYLVILHGTFTPLERVLPVESAARQERLYEQQAHSRGLGEWFHPATSAASGAMALVVAFGVVALALFAGPAEVMEPAGGERSQPTEEWWFWWVSGLVAMVPRPIAPAFVVVLPLTVLVVLLALPLVDRGPARGPRQRPVAACLVALTAATMLYASEQRRRSAWTAWPEREPPPVPAGVSLSSDGEAGRRLFAAHGCNTCHAVAGHGPAVGPDFTRLPEQRSRAYMRAFVLAPPAGAAMPAYAGRIPDDELERLLDFVHAAQGFPRR